MEEAVLEIKKAVEAGRTDVLNSVLEGCGNTAKYGHNGFLLKEKILRENVTGEGTFLHLATKRGLADVVRALLMNGADPTVENLAGENPVELASSEQIQQVYVEELLRATASSSLDRMDQLIKAGVDPNSWDCDEKKNSVLHWAVSFGNADTVAFLIGKGCGVNAETNEGVTPLHDAVDRGEIEIVKTLLKNNASPLVKASKGKFADQSPLDLAAKKPEIFSLLSQFLASQFKGRNRAASMDSIGPESPVFPKESSTFRGVSERNNNAVGDYPSSNVYSGFNSALEGVIRSLELKAPIPPIFTDHNLSLLWPQPKSLIQLEGGHFRPEKVLYVSVVKGRDSAHRVLDIIAAYKESFDALGFDVTAQQVQGICSSSTGSLQTHIQCSVNSDLLPNQSSYRLHISHQVVKVLASDLHGLNYAIGTFLQLLTLYCRDENCGIPPLVINDHPSVSHRAVLIDVSQERVPTIESLFEMIRLFSLLKINYIHLHMRFDKSGNVLPYTKGELVAIDRHCQDACMTLVPAVDIPCGITASEYFHYIKPILKTILPCFSSSKYIHVGPQLTSLMFSYDGESSGRNADFDAVWEFIPTSVSDSVLMLCYNALRSQPQSVNLSNVPPNIVLVEYGFQADYNFGSSLQELAQNGCTTSVCVGTSAWSSLAGCPEASLCNVYHGTLNAVNNFSNGIIVANWSGSSNFTPKPFAWPGFLLASGLSWNHQTHWEYLQGSLANLLSMYVLKDKSGVSGQVIIQLGCAETSLLRSAEGQPAHDMTNLPPSEGSTLYKLLTEPDSVSLDNLSMEALIKCIRAVKKCQTTLLAENRNSGEDHPVFDELILTMELMLLACRIGRSLVAAGMNPHSNMGLTVVNLGIANLSPTLRTDIANKLLLLIEDYRRVWLAQNYAHGLENSLYKLTSVLQRFIPDSTKMLTGRLMSISPKTSIDAIYENGVDHFN